MFFLQIFLGFRRKFCHFIEAKNIYRLRIIFIASFDSFGHFEVFQRSTEFLKELRKKKTFFNSVVTASQNIILFPFFFLK